MKNKELSIIIVTYNSEKDIYDCLSSIFQYNDIGDALEIIIVDNNSRNFTDMRDHIHEKFGQAIKIISNEANGGYGQGNNIGIKAATAKTVAIMNPDIRLVMPIFKTATDTLKKDNVIMCGGNQYFSEKQRALSCYAVYTLPPVLRFILNYRGIKTNYYNYKHMWLQGAFFFIRKDEFLTIGGFDEHIFMYGEEFDIHERLLKAYPNAKFEFLDQHKYLHLAGERDFSPQQYEKQLRSLIYVMEKNGYSARYFLKREKIFVTIAYSFTDIANTIHRRKKRMPLKEAKNVIEKLIKEY